jgi:hypothetical protein
MSFFDKFESHIQEVIISHIKGVLLPSFPKTISHNVSTNSFHLYPVNIAQWKEETALRLSNEVTIYVISYTRSPNRSLPLLRKHGQSSERAYMNSS